MKHDGLIAGLPVSKGRDLLRHFVKHHQVNQEIVRDYLSTERWYAGIEAALKAGRITRDLRNILRRHCNDADCAEISARWELGYKPATLRDAQAIWKRLISEGLVAAATAGERSALAKKTSSKWKLTNKGERLRTVRLTRRFDRKKAAQAISAALERAREINACDQSPLYIKRIVQYGSTLDPDAVDFGDVDIWIDFSFRIGALSDDAFSERVKAVAKAAGQRYTGNFINDIPRFFLERQLRKHLRAMSIIGMDTSGLGPVKSGWPHKVIFKGVKPKPLADELGPLPEWLIFKPRRQRDQEWVDDEA